MRDEIDHLLAQFASAGPERSLEGFEQAVLSGISHLREDARTAKALAPVSAEAATRMARRRTLELALARANADLKAATHPSHRQMLEAAIAALTAQLAQDPQ